MTTDPPSLRLALVEDLCRRGAIRSASVRDAFSRVPRERFVPEVAEERGLAVVYEDEPLITLRSPQGLAISSSSQPAIMAAMLENLALTPGLRILEIGAGTGYNAALLAELGGQVTTLDVDPELVEKARLRLGEGGPAVEVVAGDGMEGWPAAAPYDRIVVTATPPFIAVAWRDQLREGGLLEVPMLLGHDHAVAHLVVTFRRAGAELVSVAIVPGGFMGFRGPDGRPPDYPKPRMGWYDSSTKRPGGGSIYGPGPARLPAAARRRLLAGLLAGPHRTFTGRGADSELLLAVVCWTPAHRLAAVLAGGDQRLGLVDERGGLAVLLSRWSRRRPWSILGMERYGEAGEAERGLLRVFDEWRARGRPKLADYEVRVAFGRPPRGASWQLPSGGEARIGVSLEPRSG